MSGFKNFFRKNTNAIRNEPGNTTANRRHSSCEDGEDLYEAVDHEQEDNSLPFSPSPEAETSVWSENEFDDDEDIYLNESEVKPAAKTEDIEMPGLPPLPPRTRGPQNNYPTVVLPSKTQQNHQQPPPVPDYKRFKQRVGKEDSIERSESYEELDETPAMDKLKIASKTKPITVTEEEEDSDSEDYESIDSPISNKKSAPKFKKDKVLPLGTKGKSLEANPAATPSLPPRPNRSCPPVPQEIPEEMYESVEPRTSASSTPEPAIFNKLVLALKAKNLTKQSNKPEIVISTPETPEVDTYEIEDSPPLSRKNQFTRKLPEIPASDDVLANEDYEISDEPPTIPNFSSDRKFSGTTFDSLKSRKLPPTPGQTVNPDQTVIPPSRVSPSPRRNKPPPPDPEQEQHNQELKDDSPPQPPSVSKKPSNKSKSPNNIQKEIPKTVEEDDSVLKVKQRGVPYAHVTPKNKDADASASLPLPFGRKILKPNFIPTGKKPPPESKQSSFSKSSSFLQKQMTAKSIPSGNNSAEDVEAERIVEKESIKPVRNNYWKHTPPKMQTQIPTSAGTNSSEKPTKVNYPMHVPLKLLSHAVGQNQEDVSNANEENSILADAINKLKGFKGITAKEQDDDKPGERKFHGLSSKQTNQGSASQADVSPYHKEQRTRNLPSVPDSRNKKEHGKKTPPSNEKVLAKSDAKSHISNLVNKLEKQGHFAKVSSSDSGADNKPDLKSCPVVAQNINPPATDNSFGKNVREKGFKDKKVPESGSPLPKCRNKYHSEEKLIKEEPIKQSNVEETKIGKRNLMHSNTLPKPVVPSRSPVVPGKPKTVSPKDCLEDCSWYLPEVSRPDAEKKLRSIGKDGAFLVRNSQRGASLTPYSLSLLNSGRIYNLQIRKRSDNRYAIGSEKAEEQSFDNLMEMVSYHATVPIEIMGGGSKVYLLHPALK